MFVYGYFYRCIFGLLYFTNSAYLKLNYPLILVKFRYWIYLKKLIFSFALDENLRDINYDCNYIWSVCLKINNKKRWRSIYSLFVRRCCDTKYSNLSNHTIHFPRIILVRHLFVYLSWQRYIMFLKHTLYCHKNMP